MHPTISLVVTLLLAATLSAQTFLGKNVSVWTQDLARPDEMARRNAAYALGKLGAQAVPSLSRLLKCLAEDQSPKVREAAAVALGEIGADTHNQAASQLVVPALVKAIADNNYLVRRSAAFALGHLGKDAEAAKDALAAALKDERPEVKQNAAWALGKLGPAALSDLRVALADADVLVKRDAAAALASFEPGKTRQALPELLPLCRENNSEVRKAALVVLIKILTPEDTSAIAPIREALLDPDTETRVNAALALSNIGGKEAAAAVPVLVEGLRRGDLELRRQAAAALRNIGPEARAAIPELIKVLRDPDAEMRRNAALALGGLGDGAEAAVPALAELIANRDEKLDVRTEAATALKGIGPVPAAAAAVPTLLKVLGDPRQHGDVRERVLWSLRVHPLQSLATMPGVIDSFTKVTSEPANETSHVVRYDCARMLAVLQGARVSNQALDVLLECLKNKDLVIFDKQTSNVGGVGHEASTGKVNVENVYKGDGRIIAVEALEQVGPARVRQRRDIVEQLETLSTSAGYPPLREACRKLLLSLK